MKPQKNDVIFSREGALLGIAVMVPGGLDFCLGQRMMAFRLNQAIDAKYYEVVLNSAIFQAQYQSKITGTASPHLNIKDIKGLAIPLTSLQEQHSIILEVERNLSVTDAQEEVIGVSLKRAEHERQSILHEAFAGRLVPQDPNDEPASNLLERIREERKQREEAEKASKVSRKGVNKAMTKRRLDKKSGRDQQKVGLYEKLVEVGKPLPPDDLFKRVGLKTDEQPESVEVFYEELQVDVKSGFIRERRPDDVSVLLEALEPSADALAAMEEEIIEEQEPIEEPASKEAGRQQQQNEQEPGTQTLWNL